MSTLLLFIFTLFCLYSSSVTLSDDILAVSMCKHWGKHIQELHIFYRLYTKWFLFFVNNMVPA